jgi:hypothetical protein
LTSHQHEAVSPYCRQLAANPVQGLGEGRLGEHGDRIGIPQQGRQSTFLQQSAHGDNDDAGFGRSPVGGHQLQTVGQYNGDLLALGDAVGQQGVRQAVNDSVQFW